MLRRYLDQTSFETGADESRLLVHKNHTNIQADINQQPVQLLSILFQLLNLLGGKAISGSGAHTIESSLAGNDEAPFLRDPSGLQVYIVITLIH